MRVNMAQASCLVGGTDDYGIQEVVHFMVLFLGSVPSGCIPLDVITCFSYVYVLG